jgi:hypothetical protein
MAKFDTSLYRGYGDAQQRQNEGLFNAFMQNQMREQAIEQAEIDQKRKQASDPAFILSQVRGGQDISPLQQAQLDIASANAKKTYFDPNTGQLVTTGGFPDSQAAGVPQPQAMMQEPAPQIPTQVPAGAPSGAVAELQEMFAQAQTPREKAEIKKALTQEKFAIRAEERETSKKNKASARQAKELIRTAKKLRNHPALESAVGAFQGRISGAGAWSGEVGAFNALENQVLGKTFLEAREQLKGAGQVTDFEGMKGQQAMARINRVQDEDSYKEAIDDLIKVTENTVARVEGRKPPHDFSEEETAWRASMVQEGVPTVTTQQEVDALPSGAFFMEDGVKYRKP